MIALTLPGAPAVAAQSDALDISFSGSLVGTTSYTAATGEVMHGTLHAVTGNEKQTADDGVVLAGGEQGIRFSPSEWNLGQSDITQGFIAELAFTPTSSPSDMQTLFSAGGNFYVRSQGGKLRYGFDSHSDSGWATHAESVTFPSLNKQHVLSLEYLPGGDSTSLHVSVDGTELPTVTSDVSAAINGNAAAAFGIGNDVHPQGLDRGFVGSIAKVRIADTAGPYSPGAYEFQPKPLTTDLLATSFGGTLSGSGAYSPVAADTVDGTLVARNSDQKVGDSGAEMDGGTDGVDFAAADPVFSGDSLDQAFVMEAAFTPAADQTDLATLLAVGGNLFVRYQNGKLRYGFSSNSNGSWSDHVEEAAVPSAGKQHIISVAYVPGSTTTMTVWLDGVALPEISSSAPSTPNAKVATTLSIGNEVAAQAADRGFSGTIAKARFAVLNGDFAPDAFTYQKLTEQHCDPLDIEPANYITVTPADCDANILTKSTLVRPTSGQLDWQQLRLTAFVHFGINTFYNQEWGYGTEDPKKFDPTDQIDPDAWVKELRDAGFRQAILVVKHHDGFLLYPSRYTDYDVASSPWKNGKGDVLAEFTAAAHKYGMKVGVYLSPADSHEELLGVYGNGSMAVDHTIPTLVPGDDRAGKDIPSFTYKVDDYNAYFLNQLYEVLTQYGPINEVWFDGAEGNTTKTEIHDYASYYSLIHKLQPNALVAVGGRDIRWVGNENGVARDDEWAPQPIVDPADGGQISEAGSAAGSGDLGSDSSLISAVHSGAADDLHWWPAEADMKLTSGWFAHPGDQPKSPASLLNSYEVSTGHNGLMLLNVPPTTTGLFAPDSVTAIDDFATLRRKTFGKNVALGVPAVVDGSTTTAITDDDSTTSWASKDASTHTVEIDLGSTEKVDTITLSEDVAAHGQSVDGFTVQAYADGAWKTISSGGTIGVYRVLPLSTAVSAQKFRVTVGKARGPYSLADVSLYQTLQNDPGRMSEVYLDCSAPVAGDGRSAAHPFDSLEQFRQAEIAPGATVHIKSGTSCGASQTLFWGYGTAADPITVTTYDGNVAPTAGGAPIADLFTPLEAQGWKVDLPASHSPSISLGSTMVKAGSTMSIAVDGFQADAAVKLTLHSSPVTLGTVTTDAHGHADTSVTIPAATAPGPHAVVATQGEDQARADLTVTAATPGTGGGTGSGGDDGGTTGSGGPGASHPGSGAGQNGSPGPSSSGTKPAADHSAPQRISTGDSNLAETGADAMLPVGLALLALLAGGVLIGIRRSRRNRLRHGR